MSDADPAPPVVDDRAALRAAALLPDQLLHGGEVVILLLKPSPWYVVLESLGFLAGVVLVLALALLLANRGYLLISKVDLALLAIALSGVRLVWQFLEWLSRVYVLTDRRVVRIMGVLRVQVFETSLQKIQHTVTFFTLRERLFGLGTIAFATAGTAGIEATWRMVARPLEVHRRVIWALDRYR